MQFDAGLMATTDFDLLWDARGCLKLAALRDDVAQAGVLAIFRKVDRSFEPLSQGGFRASSKADFFVDQVKQALDPSWKDGEPERIADGYLTPSWLPNIKWLLASEKFQAVVVGQDGLPAPMVAPDPRSFAVYKWWLGSQDDRDPARNAAIASRGWRRSRWCAANCHICPLVTKVHVSRSARCVTRRARSFARPRPPMPYLPANDYTRRGGCDLP